MRPTALRCSALCLGGATAQAATLRTMTTLHAPVVRLSDLFDDAGANADRVLGPGPGAGGRIVVEAAQLGAIARQFGVDWRPVSSADRAVLEWPGRPLRREDVLDAVRAALIAGGASADCDIELAGFTPPLVPVEATAAGRVATSTTTPTAGRFSAVLSVAGEAMEPIIMRIGGRVDDTVELPVADDAAARRQRAARRGRAHGARAHLAGARRGGAPARRGGRHAAEAAGRRRPAAARWPN